MGFESVHIPLLILLFILLYYLFKSTPFLDFVRQWLGWNRLEETHILSDECVDNRKWLSDVESGFYKANMHKDSGSSTVPEIMVEERSSGISDFLSLEPRDSSPLSLVERQRKDSLTPIQTDITAHVSYSTSDEEVAEKTNPAVLHRAQSTESIDSACSFLSEQRDNSPTIQLTIAYNTEDRMVTMNVYQLYDCNIEYPVWLVFYLLPHPKPLWCTKEHKINGHCVVFNECFKQCVRQRDIRKITLAVQLYSRKEKITPEGQCRLRLRDIPLNDCRPIHLPLLRVDEKNEADITPIGEIFFTLLYTNERLSIVVEKIRKMPDDVGEALVRIYVVQPGGRIMKKKTTKRSLVESAATFDESIIMNVPRAKLDRCTIRLSVVEVRYPTMRSLGRVTLGPRTSGKELGHFQRLLTPHDRPISMWHEIKPRKTRT